MPDVINNVTVTLDDLGHELAECLDAVKVEDFQTLSFERLHGEENTSVKIRRGTNEDLERLREFPGSSKLIKLRDSFAFKKIPVGDGIRQETPWNLHGRELNVYYHWTEYFEQVIFWDKKYYDRKFQGTPFY